MINGLFQPTSYQINCNLITVETENNILIMKNLILILLVITSAISCNYIEKEERILVKEEGELLLVINAPKARCYKRQQVIEGGLQKVDGVSQSILDLSKKQVSIAYTPECITPELLSSTVEKLIEEIPCK